MTGPVLRTLQDVRTSAARIVELTDTILFRKQSIDAAVALPRLPETLRLLIARAQRALEALEGQS